MQTQRNYKQQILELLKADAKQYNRMYEEAYFQWAELYSGGCHQFLQKLMISKPIRAWFSVEFDKLEHEFLETAPYYSRLQTKDIEFYYTSVISGIFKVYPKTLLECIELKTKKRV